MTIVRVTIKGLKDAFNLPAWLRMKMDGSWRMTEDYKLNKVMYPTASAFPGVVSFEEHINRGPGMEPLPEQMLSLISFIDKTYQKQFAVTWKQLLNTILP